MGIFTLKINTNKRLLRQLNERINQMARTLDEVLAKITEQDTKLDSVRELIAGLRQQVADALAQIGNISPENQAKIDAIFTAAEKNSAEIEEALDANVTVPPVNPIP